MGSNDEIDCSSIATPMNIIAIATKMFHIDFRIQLCTLA